MDIPSFPAVPVSPGRPLPGATKPSAVAPTPPRRAAPSKERPQPRGPPVPPPRTFASMTAAPPEGVAAYRGSLYNNTTRMLPQEIVMEVFAYLAYDDLACAAGATCRKWNIIAQTRLLWRNLCVAMGVATIEEGVHPRFSLRNHVEMERRRANEDLLAVKTRFRNTNARLAARTGTSEPAPFTAGVVSQQSAEAPRLAQLVTTFEDRTRNTNVALRAAVDEQGAVERSLREGKVQLSAVAADVAAARASVDAMATEQRTALLVARFQHRVAAVLLQDEADVPLVLRRGITTFHGLELLVLQMGGQRQRLAQRWAQFKRLFPLNDDWFALQDTVLGGGGGVGVGARRQPSLATAKRDVLLRLMRSMVSIPAAELLASVDTAGQPQP